MIPERRLWVEIANTLLLDFGWKLAAVKSQLRRRGSTTYRLKREVEGLLNEAKSPWFGVICELAECHQDHIVKQFQAKLDAMNWESIPAVESHSLYFGGVNDL